MLGRLSNLYIWFLEKEEFPCRAVVQAPLGTVLSWECEAAYSGPAVNGHSDPLVTFSKEWPLCCCPEDNPWHASKKQSYINLPLCKIMFIDQHTRTRTRTHTQQGNNENFNGLVKSLYFLINVCFQ